MSDEPVDVEEWLDTWVEENLQSPGYHEYSSDMAHEAAQCRADSATQGISEADLMSAAGGDLEAFLLGEQNAFTDAELRRKTKED